MTQMRYTWSHPPMPLIAKGFNVMKCIGPSAPLISDVGLFWANVNGYNTGLTEANVKIFGWDQV